MHNKYGIELIVNTEQTAGSVCSVYLFVTWFSDNEPNYRLYSTRSCLCFALAIKHSASEIYK